MLMKAVFLGLVLTSLVLAIPTKMEDNSNDQITDHVTDKNEIRRELMNKEMKEERRDLDGDRINKDDQRRGTDEISKERDDVRRDLRRDTDEERKESRRGTDEQKKDERRSMNEEKKEDSRRGTDKMSNDREEIRRDINGEKKDEEKEQRRDINEEKKDDSRRAIDSAEREKRRPTPAIKDEKRESDSKKDDKRRVDNIDDSINSEESIRNKRDEKAAKEVRDVEKNTTTSGDLNICESVTDFKYYQKYASDPSKYIQCDPWGTGIVKSCPEGQFWNEWTLRCDIKENIHNMTLDLSKFSVTTASRPIVNCSIVGMECINGGSCVQSVSGDYKCACRSDFTGQFCESRVDLTDITHEILNSTFSVLDYRRHIQEENLTMSLSYYEKFKDQLDNLTYTELIRYLSFYKDGEVRYDTLVNSLVEDILENIYPDAEYLSVFNASEQNVVAMVQMIPSLLSYSRYSFDRYEDVFAQYQHVLVRLAQLLNSSLPTIRDEASQYTVLTRIFLNQTVTLMKNLEDHSLVVDNPTIDQPIQLTENDIKRALQYNYNETLKATERLLVILETFQSSVITELQTNPSSVVNTTLGQAKFSGAQEMLTVLNQVSVASGHIWESLVNYGFWYLTNYFSTSTSKVDTIQRFSFNLNKF